MVEKIRTTANNHLDKNNKIEYGQFMTPSSVSTFMASLFPESNYDKIYLLDPGSGVGSLTFAFINNAMNWKKVKEISIDAYEIDDIMIKYLQSNIENIENDVAFNTFSLKPKIIKEDFILSASEIISNNYGLWAEKKEKYTHCIMNPPYKKIACSSIHRKYLSNIGIETVNLYSGFVALSLELLNENGYLVAIIPRSFCNGTYYKPFRDYILKRSSIKQIHLFESRTNAFKDDKVLQENIIILLEKSGKQGDVIISTSTDDRFTDLTSKEFDFNSIVNSTDNNLFIHIPTIKNNISYQNSNYISSTLDEIGIQVSTGPIVDYRLKKYLKKDYINGTIPLIYPAHFEKMTVIWPKENFKKYNAIINNEDTDKWFYPNDYYIVVRRFSSKEEKRRIVASVFDPHKFAGFDFVAFENHLNVFHINKNGLPEDLAYGLAIYLNSKMFDDAFRLFSGHTQVNATDLRGMKYPNKETLIILGKKRKNYQNLTTEIIDDLLTRINGG